MGLQNIIDRLKRERAEVEAQATPAMSTPTPTEPPIQTVAQPATNGSTNGEVRPYREAANDTDPSPDPDRWCWPHSDAMNGAEIDRMLMRLDLFASRGLEETEADKMADTLMRRDRNPDSRTACMECAHLASPSPFRCGNPEPSWGQIHQHKNRAGLDSALSTMLHICHGFIRNSEGA